MMGVAMMVVREGVWERVRSGMEAARKRSSSVTGPWGVNGWLVVGLLGR